MKDNARFYEHTASFNFFKKNREGAASALPSEKCKKLSLPAVLQISLCCQAWGGGGRKYKQIMGKHDESPGRMPVSLFSTRVLFLVDAESSIDISLI